MGSDANRAAYPLCLLSRRAFAGINPVSRISSPCGVLLKAYINGISSNYKFIICGVYGALNKNIYTSCVEKNICSSYEKDAIFAGITKLSVG